MFWFLFFFVLLREKSARFSESQFLAGFLKGMVFSTNGHFAR